MPVKKAKAKKEREFKMPEWIDCSWRRKSCDRDECPICGRIKRDREKRIARGENPDDMKYVIKDVSRNLKKTLALMRKDAEKFGIDIENVEAVVEPPEPENFPLNKEVDEWRNSVFSLAEGSGNPPWAYTESAEDLFWYANTISAKTYRQLCNRWQLERGSDFENFDYAYTKRVLTECFEEIRKAVSDLMPICSNDKVKLMLIADGATRLKEKVLKI
jgi:hypothetical protein